MESVRHLLSLVNNSRLLFEFDVLISASQMAQHYDSGSLGTIKKWLNEVFQTKIHKKGFMKACIQYQQRIIIIIDPGTVVAKKYKFESIRTEQDNILTQATLMFNLTI